VSKSGIAGHIHNMRTTVIDSCRKLDGHGSVNIAKNRHVCDSCQLLLSGVEYGPLFHSRHSGRDRVIKAGHGIKHLTILIFSRNKAMLVSISITDHFAERQTLNSVNLIQCDG